MPFEGTEKSSVTVSHIIWISLPAQVPAWQKGPFSGALSFRHELESKGCLKGMGSGDLGLQWEGVSDSRMSLATVNS